MSLERMENNVKDWLPKDFSLPTGTKLDPRLLAGAALFGIGWGLYGYCPGPALSALVYMDAHTVAFVFAMIAGMALAGRVPAGRP